MTFWWTVNKCDKGCMNVIKQVCKIVILLYLMAGDILPMVDVLDHGHVGCFNEGTRSRVCVECALGDIDDRLGPFRLLLDQAYFAPNHYCKMLSMQEMLDVARRCIEKIREILIFSDLESDLLIERLIDLMRMGAYFHDWKAIPLVYSGALEEREQRLWLNTFIQTIIQTRQVPVLLYSLARHLLERFDQSVPFLDSLGG